MDFSKAFGATVREVASGERDGRPTHIVRASRSYQTTQTDLWSAVTEKDRVQRWFGEVSGEFRLGGRFSIQGNADGRITICEPPKALALTWEFGGNTSWVSAKLENTQDGVLLTIEHELPTDETSEAHWDNYGPGATGVGWELGMLGLTAYLAGNGQSTLAAGGAWADGASGKNMLCEWAEAWGLAHVKAGTDHIVAMESADRTAKFYTGEC